MGLGYSIMLEVADRVLLSTSPSGTTVMLMKDLTEKKPEDMFDSIPDTWRSVPG